MTPSWRSRNNPCPAHVRHGDRSGLPDYGYYRRLGFGLIEPAKALDHRDPSLSLRQGITFACSKSVIDSRRCLTIARSIRWVLAS